MNKTPQEKLKEIYDGWKNWLFKTPEVEKLAKDRSLHCIVCNSNKANCCAECGCLLPAKLRSTKLTNKCLLNKWEK